MRSFEEASLHGVQLMNRLVVGIDDGYDHVVIAMSDGEGWCLYDAPLSEARQIAASILNKIDSIEAKCSKS